MHFLLCLPNCDAHQIIIFVVPWQGHQSSSMRDCCLIARSRFLQLVYILYNYACVTYWHMCSAPHDTVPKQYTEFRAECMRYFNQNIPDHSLPQQALATVISHNATQSSVQCSQWKSKFDLPSPLATILGSKDTLWMSSRTSPPISAARQANLKSFKPCAESR